MSTSIHSSQAIDGRHIQIPIFFQKLYLPTKRTVQVRVHTVCTAHTHLAHTSVPQQRSCLPVRLSKSLQVLSLFHLCAKCQSFGTCKLSIHPTPFSSPRLIKNFVYLPSLSAHLNRRNFLNRCSMTILSRGYVTKQVGRFSGCSIHK